MSIVSFDIIKLQKLKDDFGNKWDGMGRDGMKKDGEKQRKMKKEKDTS